MKTSRLMIALAVASHCTAFAAPVYRTVTIRDNAVCVAEGSLPGQCFGKDEQRKSLPLFSKDGNRIAVISQALPNTQLATLLVFDRHGQRLATIPIKPVVKGEVESGMRAVEYLEWIDQNRIVVGGSINPSSGEYLVIDASTGRTLQELVDDGAGIAVSPDGAHLASISGAPHFASAATQAAKLVVDGNPVLALQDLGVTVDGRPLWSPDSGALAIRVRRRDELPALLVWNRNLRTHSLTSLPAPAQPGSRAAMAWRGADLVAVNSAAEARPGRPAMAAETTVLKNAAGSARPVVSHIKGVPGTSSTGAGQSVPPAAGRQADGNTDVWCADCAPGMAPRATGPLAGSNN
jgi:hypothetical protein